MRDLNRDLLEFGFRNPLYPNALCIKLNEVNKMEFEVKEHIELKDGSYEGEITSIKYRDDPYEYTDVYIKEKDSELELKYGCPSVMTIKTKLGILMSQFVDLETGIKLDPEKVLIGKKVKFMTITEKTKKGEFTNIVSGSVKKI